MPRKSQIGESFGPVHRNAMPTAPAHTAAMISKVGHLGGAGAGAGAGPAMISKVRHSRGLTPTAADPKEKLPSESVRGCSEKVLKASGEPFGVEGLRFGVESFTRNVVSPHLVAERAQVRLEKRMRRKAEDGHEGTVASGFGTREALRSAFGASSGTRNRLRWRIPTSGRPSTAEGQET